MNMRLVDLDNKTVHTEIVPDAQDEPVDLVTSSSAGDVKVDSTIAQHTEITSQEGCVDVGLSEGTRRFRGVCVFNFDSVQSIAWDQSSNKVTTTAPEPKCVPGACSSLEDEPLPMYGPVARPSEFEDTHYGKDIVDLSAEQGVVGMYNLGNTCFMNSGLQCLFSIPRLVRFFHRDFDDSDVQYASLTYQFNQILSKVWTGQYTILYPKEFKNLLGAYHPQFQDYRQHDCQELLALLLDTLHEQLNEGSAGCKGTKALEEAGATDASSSARQQSVQSEDSEMPGSASQSGSHTPADRSASQSPVEPVVENPDNSNIVHSLSGTAGAEHTAGAMQSKVQFVSEDSNQSIATRSDTSCQSSELLAPEDHEQRMKSIPEEMKVANSAMFEPIAAVSSVFPDPGADSGRSEQTVDTHQVPKVEMEQDGCSPEKRLNLEDFYMKDTKTLNLNVVAEEYMHEEIATDSEKFHKHDNVERPSDPFETLSDFIMNEVKSPTSKPLKDSNLLANFREKFDPQNEAFPKKCLFSDIKNLRGDEEAEWDEAAGSTTVTGFCSINNIKRLKVDEDEKNVRMQARLKVNTNKMPAAGSDDSSNNIRLLSPGDQAGLRGEGDNTVRVPNPNTLNPRTADVVTSPLEEQMRAQNLAEAERAWKKYQEGNRSIIVDTFQGQFKSTVICSECDHVSVTYEPFMYLSVPLPHATERQISVIFIPSDSKQPVRYLITLNKTSSVKKLKTMLLELVGEESVDIIIAEVFDNHISRILDEGTLLRYINDYNRTIYAFEMLPPPLLDEEVSGNMSDDTSTITTSDATSHGSTDTLIGATNNCTVSSGSLGVIADDSGPSCMDVTQSSEPSVSASDLHRSASEPTFVTNNHKASTGSAPDSKELDSAQILNNFPGQTEQAWDSGLDTSENCVPSILDNFTDNMCTSTTDFEGKKDEEVPIDWETGQDAEATSTGGNYGSTSGGTPLQDPLEGLDLSCGGPSVTDSWKSCAICLEEMSDSDLMVHTACGGTLCQACLERSYKHYGESSFVCPVCSSPVHPADDFVQLSDAAGYKPKNRILSVPIVYRTVQPGDPKPEAHLFGHPNILYLSSNTTGETLYDTVDRVVPCFANYSIALTDGQGLRCSRCMFTAHCAGCEVPRFGDVHLQPGDHLAVCFSDLLPEQMEVARAFIDHRSMQELRKKDYLTLFDCFHAFTDCETLDEHNPWYCPQCKQNQCARKTITVWRYPETLVIYLKRFVFHELSSSKIDDKVIFPLENLDLSEFISGPITNKMLYDLQSCVCHFGGVNAGHYTAYTKHPVTNQWHYFNDESTSVRSLQDDDYSNAYILFYRRQGSNIDLNLPEKCSVDLKPRCSVSDDCASDPSGGAQFDTDEVTSQLLKILQNSERTEMSQEEANADSAATNSAVHAWDQTSEDGCREGLDCVDKTDSAFEFYT